MAAATGWTVIHLRWQQSGCWRLSEFDRLNTIYKNMKIFNNNSWVYTKPASFLLNKLKNLFISSHFQFRFFIDLVSLHNTNFDPKRVSGLHILKDNRDKGGGESQITKCNVYVIGEKIKYLEIICNKDFKTVGWVE